MTLAVVLAVALLLAATAGSHVALVVALFALVALLLADEVGRVRRWMR